MRRGAQVVAVAVVRALLGVLVGDDVHQSGGKVARDVDRGQIVRAPLFTRNRVDTSGTLSLASLRGKVVVLNFWQSYCAPCTREARTLADGYRRWAGKHVVFLGIDEQDLHGPALKFLRRFDITYPIVADDLALTGHYGVTGYPETFFIDRHGRVVPPHIVGPATRKTLDDGIRRALKE
jgi:cytochrome c biogenesis protein CcmG/thiol:disulfide interchange protein DsbE